MRLEVSLTPPLSRATPHKKRLPQILHPAPGYLLSVFSLIWRLCITYYAVMICNWINILLGFGVSRARKLAIRASADQVNVFYSVVGRTIRLPPRVYPYTIGGRSYYCTHTARAFSPGPRRRVVELPWGSRVERVRFDPHDRNLDNPGGHMAEIEVLEIQERSDGVQPSGKCSKCRCELLLNIGGGSLSTRPVR